MPKKKHATKWTDQKMNPIDVQERLDGYVNMVQNKMNSYWKRWKYKHKKKVSSMMMPVML